MPYQRLNISKEFVQQRRGTKSNCHQKFKRHGKQPAPRQPKRAVKPRQKGKERCHGKRGRRDPEHQCIYSPGIKNVILISDFRAVAAPFSRPACSYGDILGPLERLLPQPRIKGHNTGCPGRGNQQQDKHA